MIKFTFIFIILYWVLAQPKGEKAINKYITFCAILFIAMMGLRNEAIFGDTYSYVSNFNELSSYSLKDVLERWEKDPVFWISSYLLYPVIGGNYTIWLSLIAILFMFPVTKLIRKYSEEPMYSWIIFIFIGFMFFAMAGLRQTVAMGIDLIGFLILLDQNRTKRNRIIWFVALVVLASRFHGTALLCLMGLLFVDRQFGGKAVAFYLLTLVAGWLLGSSLLTDATYFLGQYDERYLLYAEDMHGSNTTYFIQQLIIVLPTLYSLRNSYKNPFVATLCHFSIIGLLFVSLSPFIAEMFRVSFYFSWANIILFPMAIKAMRKVIPALPIVFLLFFVVYLVFVNKTAWQEYYFWFENTNHIIQHFNIG